MDSSPDLSFSDLIHLANTPGPMQGMAQAMLRRNLSDSMDISPSPYKGTHTPPQMDDLVQRYADGPTMGEMQARLRPRTQDDVDADHRSVRIGMHSSPGAGPGGLNFGDPTGAHGSYPSELLDDLVQRYGTQTFAPSDDSGQPDIQPDPRAISAYTDEMHRYEPSLWDRIKSVGHAVADDPSSLVDGLHSIAEYMTPVWGNLRGSQDFTSDAADMRDAWPSTPDHGDPLGVLLQYLPALGGDTMQMMNPLGFGRPKFAKGGSVYDTELSPSDEKLFQYWKQQYAPNDSGRDYDLRGAFKAGLKPAANGHWPSEPTFSDESQYAPLAPDQAGHWWGDTLVPPRSRRLDILPKDWY